MKTTLLLVDASMMIYRALFAHPTLTHEGTHTGALYGAVQQLTSAINRYEATAVIVCYDRPPYFRSEQFPEYKQGRSFADTAASPLLQAISETDDVPPSSPASAVIEAGEAIRTVARTASARLKIGLGTLGIPFYQVPGLEADDLIAIGVKEFSCEFDRTVILSSDSDLYQLLDGWNVAMVRKGGTLYFYRDFVAEFGIQPCQWVQALCLMGTHNGVPGIKGIGPKKAAKILRGEMEWKEEYKAMFAVNEPLVVLPHAKADVDAVMPRINLGRLHEQNFIRWLAKYGIEYAHPMMLAVQQIKRSIRRHGTVYH